MTEAFDTVLKAKEWKQENDDRIRTARIGTESADTYSKLSFYG
jgi:hypothetical protein